MTQMNDVQKKHCYKVIDKILKYDVSQFLKDQEIFNLIKESKLKKKVDLTMIREKLDSNSYQTISLWQDDMEQLFKNCEHVGDPYRLIAKEIHILFGELIKSVPKNEVDEWKLKVYRRVKKFEKMMEWKPDTVTQQVGSHPKRNTRKK